MNGSILKKVLEIKKNYLTLNSSKDLFICMLYLLMFSFLTCFHVYGQFERQGIPAETKYQTFVTEPVTLPKGFFRAGLNSILIFDDRYFDEKGRRKILPKGYQPTSISTTLSVSYAISDRLQAQVYVPYIRSIIRGIYKYIDSQYNIIEEVPMKITSSGLGDISVEIMWQLKQGNTERSAIALGNLITVPTGRKNPYNISSDVNYNNGVGQGRYVISPFLCYKKIFYPYSVYLEESFSWLSGGEKIFSPGEDMIKFFPTVIVSSAAKFGFHINDWLVISNSLSLVNKSKTKVEGTYYESENSSMIIDEIPGIYFQVKKLRLNHSVSFPLAGRNTGADPVYYVTIQFVF